MNSVSLESISRLEGFKKKCDPLPPHHIHKPQYTAGVGSISVCVSFIYLTVFLLFLFFWFGGWGGGGS